MHEKTLFAGLIGLCLLTLPAAAQAVPPSPQQILQQQNQTVQTQTDSFARSMTQQQIGQIQERQREQQLFMPPPFQQPFAPPVYRPAPPR